jgi:hypothetical protein
MRATITGDQRLALPTKKKIHQQVAGCFLVLTAIALGIFEYILEHHRPAHAQGAFDLYHKGYGAIVYVSTIDLLIYWALSMICIASALLLAFLVIDRKI